MYYVNDLKYEIERQEEEINELKNDKEERLEERLNELEIPIEEIYFEVDELYEKFIPESERQRPMLTIPED